MFGKISACWMAILLSVSGIIGQRDVANPATASMFNMAAFNAILLGRWEIVVSESCRHLAPLNAAGLSKTFHLTERMRMHLENPFTSLFNHPNFAPPPTNVRSSSFGIVQSVQAAQNSGNRGFATARLLDCRSETLSELLV